MFNDDYKYSYNPTCVKKSTVLLISNDETTFDEYCMMAFLAGEFSKEKKSFTIEEITKKISEEKDSKDYTVKEVYEILKLSRLKAKDS